MSFGNGVCAAVISSVFHLKLIAFKSSLPSLLGIIEIPITRHGSDLSIPTSVWCATRTSDPPSATPGFDYIPSSKKVEFHPGRTEEVWLFIFFLIVMEGLVFRAHHRKILQNGLFLG